MAAATSAREELRRLKEFARDVDGHLGVLEKQLYELETDYIESTSGTGNLVQGFEGFQDRHAHCRLSSMHNCAVNMYMRISSGCISRVAIGFVTCSSSPV